MAGRPPRSNAPSWRLTRRQFLGTSAAALVAVPQLSSAPRPAVRRRGHGGPTSLTVAGLVAPVGLGPDDLRYGWQVAGGRRGVVQRAYRIVVERPTLAGPGRGRATTVWDSGMVQSSQQAFVPYRGPPLAADTTYRFSVQTFDAEGPSPFSSPARFDTGLLAGDWRAQWITRTLPGSSRPDLYTYSRTVVALRPSPVVRARIYVSGDQQYELYVNGQRAGKGEAYSFPDSQYYETLDVTSLLEPGAENALAFITSWQGATKGHPAGRPGLIAQCSVLHEDGGRTQVFTDGSWRVHQGAWLPGTQRDLEGDRVDFTENIDGRQVPSGWQQASFDDSSWQRAEVLGRAGTSPWSSLVPVRTRILYQPLRPVTLTTLASGAVVADFGRIYAAVPRVSFSHGVAGRLVTMRAGYLLDEPVPGQPFTGQPGQVSTTRGTQHTDMSYSYIQRGGVETFQAFDYLGFRYFQIDDPGEDLTADDVTASRRHAEVPDAAGAPFSSSEPTVDAIYELGRHSALYSAQEQFIDTPTREKGPWLWDGFNESLCAMALLGDQNMTAKSLKEFAQSQGRFWRNGAVNKIYPTGLGALDINEYTEIYPEWVFQYFMATGDQEILRSLYQVLERLSRYVARSIESSSGLVVGLPSTNVYYAFPTVTRLNVLGANVFRRTADIAEVLGRPHSEVRALRRHQASLTRAINARLRRADGVYVDGLDAAHRPVATASQDTNACAVVYGVAPAEGVATVASYVAGLGMQAPPRTATEVLEALCLAGRFDDMVGILTNPSLDGWARILALGGTFTWEVWEPSDAAGDSMSHGWGANVAVAIQRWLLGVRPLAPGYTSSLVAPPTGGLRSAAGTRATPAGPLRVAWRRGGGTSLDLDLEVPPNASAKVRLAGTLERLQEGGRPVGARRDLVAGSPPGFVEVAVGSGAYRFAMA